MFSTHQFFCGVKEKENASKRIKCATEGFAKFRWSKLFVNLGQNISLHNSHFQKHTMISHFARNF